MNCSQARAMLATYRELKKDQADTTALEGHLAQCTSCRAAYTHADFVGKSLRALPQIEPSPEAHAKLMQALAAEHVRFMHRTSASAASTPTPAFLAPYLKDVAQQTPHNLVALSTADTGPLPIIQAPRPRRSYQMSHFAILGLAASFLMVLMIGGLTSLLLLAHGVVPPTNPVSLNKSSEVASTMFSTTATYPHIASAVANGENIYYTTYNDGATNWMLEQYNSQTKTDTPLLSLPSTNELVVLSSSPDWLVWLQLDAPKQSLHAADTTHNRSWSLHTLSLSKTPLTTSNSSTTIVSNRFNQNSVPGWVTTPLQGTWFIGNKLLVAWIDNKGTSHLSAYQLDKSQGKTEPGGEIASTSNGHILTSPTGNSDGTNIYWSEEWLTNDNTLSSTIWARQVVDATPSRPGRWAAHTNTITYAFPSDGRLFHPQMVNDTLFLLKTDPKSVQANRVAATPSVIATPQATGAATARPSATPTGINTTNLLGGALTIDPLIYSPQIDSAQTGRLLVYTANGIPESLPQWDSNRPVSTPQAGTHFLLWQNTATKSIEMYDVEARAFVNVGDHTISRNATFLHVNGDVAVWAAVTPDAAANQADGTPPTVTFGQFSLPAPATTKVTTGS